jgi:hypothetical protein
MDRNQLNTLKRKFLDYSDNFIAKADNPDPFILKKQHTFRVCEEILYLGKKLLLPEQDLVLAEAIALLHDIGRFIQLEKYGTFLDRISENHAKLGLGVIDEQKLLDLCNKEEANIIKEAVGFHNAATTPKNRDERTLFFIKLTISRYITLPPYRNNAQLQRIAFKPTSDTPGPLFSRLSSKRASDSIDKTLL